MTNVDDLAKKIQLLDEAYRAGNPLVSDLEFDKLRALRRTDARELKYNAQGLKIQDARVFAKKDSFGRFKPGIYRVNLKKGSTYKTFITPLFFFDKKPSVKPKTVTFFDLVKKSADANVGKIFLRELNKYGR